MKILAISGSARHNSTNTAMLRAVSFMAPATFSISVFDQVGALPVFSPDLETDELPPPVCAFMNQVAASDGLIVSSPEYVRSIPGGLKNAIDWLVSGNLLTTKPIALMHASHRGDDMLVDLRTVLGTVSSKFSYDLFLRFSLMNLTPDQISEVLSDPQNRERIKAFLDRFSLLISERAGVL
ncbi:NAD(P)H-dependent oxidoreductase [Komagataeibacter intermedius]|uniref:NADPH-dependent FMN reductase n=2 Tax=Komagataeibacter intermedius TaxID=66229 RepID=A0A0N1F8C4_9PROT|nr:NADPH-dependent FMN reductase [Komagataeibacter intermedius]KPH85881.1 NADPH-dependent FMN reductase [Komagataeibacter intermedius AF2]MCF3637383.1 NAD(P)H-dependent oxidoreductase [Komagataeibacter intermedius]